MSNSRKRVPTDAVQHKTAGPYSPVIEVDAGRLVVVSGQVSVDLDGNVVGTTIQEQARTALDNCSRQLASAGVSFSDVFKVNVYLSDLSDWALFNAAYNDVMPVPPPVRTAIQGGAASWVPRRDRSVGRQAGLVPAVNHDRIEVDRIKSAADDGKRDASLAWSQKK